MATGMGHSEGMKAQLRRLLPLVCLGAFAGSAACADEIVKTGVEGAPPVAQIPPAQIGDPNAPEAIGAWARGVMAGERAAPDESPTAPSRCAANADGKAHGEVWAGVGTHGYREVGGVVTQPIGACSQVTIAVDRTEGGGYGGWRRR
jgi:hypothetical protein